MRFAGGTKVRPRHVLPASLNTRSDPDFPEKVFFILPHCVGTGDMVQFRPLDNVSGIDPKERIAKRRCESLQALPETARGQRAAKLPA